MKAVPPCGDMTNVRNLLLQSLIFLLSVCSRDVLMAKERVGHAVNINITVPFWMPLPQCLNFVSVFSAAFENNVADHLYYVTFASSHVPLIYIYTSFY